MNIVPLEWDSRFFDLNVGSLVISQSDIFDFNEFKKESESFDLIYIISDYKIDNFNLVDEKEIFINNDISLNGNHFSDTISFSTEIHSYDQLLNLTLQSGKYSRFNTDKNFKNMEYEKLYTEWLDKSINKDLAIDIIVKIIDNEIVGFITLNNKTDSLAEIGLIAVDKAYRGQGIAKELINKTIWKASKLNFKSIQVVTQHNNKPAVKLYTSTGFKSESITNIYHYWNL